MNFRTSIDFFTANVLLPLGGFLIAIFVGWFMKTETTRHEMQQDSPHLHRVWRFVLRYFAPVAVLVIIVNGLYPVLTRVMGE